MQVSNTPENPIPFFVADRQMSLKLLRHCHIQNQSFPVGLMGNANSSPNFHKAFARFKGKNVVKIVDSGIFTKEGGLSKDYEELFEKYETMETNYGIIMDVIKNKKETLRSAKDAMIQYRKKKYSFKLVGVAQGKTVKEYLSCYRALKKIGYQNIAIGGLLAKRENSVRYVTVRNEKFMEDVVSTIRKYYPHDWIFLLGCFRPKRFGLLKKYNVFGADFKGWIFNYKNPGEKRAKHLRDLHNIENVLKIKNPILKKLIKKYRDRKAILLDSEQSREQMLRIIKIRKKISKMIKNHEYDENLDSLDKLMDTDDDKMRDFRFAEVNKFLHKQVFSLMHSKKLLIVSCSERKRDLMNLTPAVQLYDGPMFRMIRKFQPIYYNGVDLMIVSAKYGLVPHNRLIRNYDQRLTPERLPSLQKESMARLQGKLSTATYNQIMLSMGKEYMRIFDGIEKIVSPNCEIVKSEGRIGEKLHHTKKWLGKS
jgi:hypothetical protein